mgnify:FL=1
MVYAIGTPEQASDARKVCVLAGDEEEEEEEEAEVKKVMPRILLCLLCSGGLDSLPSLACFVRCTLCSLLVFDFLTLLDQSKVSHTFDNPRITAYLGMHACSTLRHDVRAYTHIFIIQYVHE